MSRFTILLGGDLVPTQYLAALAAGTRVIAADSGMYHAAPLGLEPELWLGDFDSVGEEIIEAHASVPRQIFPSEKDQTDGELAVRVARERGASELLFVGAFGGPRGDHAFLHITMAIALAEQGVAVRLSDGRQEGAPLMPGLHTFSIPHGTLFSVLAFSRLEGLTIKGAKWPLDDVEVPFGSSLTISNEVSGDLSIGLETGRAFLLFQCPDAKNR